MNMGTYRLWAYDGLKCELLEREEASREALMELATTVSKLESLHCNSMSFAKELLVTRADVALKSSLREESWERLDTMLIKLKKA